MDATFLQTVQDVLQLDELEAVSYRHLATPENNEIDFWLINRMLVFSVEVSPRVNRTDKVIDAVNEFGDILGSLILSKGMEYNEHRGFSDIQKYALILDHFTSPSSSLETDNFQSDYFVVVEGAESNYLLNYDYSSFLWGNFFRKTNAFLIMDYTFYSNMLNATSGIRFHSKHFDPTSKMSVLASNPYEQYLRLYHLIELSFDTYFFNQVKSMNFDTQTKEIAQLYNYLSNSSKGGELNRLTEIIKFSFTGHEAELSNLLSNVQAFDTPLKDMLFKYRKDSNSIDESKYDNLKILNFALGTPLSGRRFSEEDLISFVSYLLYRVRCSIAHNRIGEYLLGVDEIPLMNELMLPLIKKVVLEIHKI